VNRTNLFIGALLIVLFGVSLLFYYLYKENKQIEIWDLLPNQVVAVYEPGECSECIIQLKESKFWKLLNQLLIHEKNADSIGNIFGQLYEPVNKPLIAIQVTQNNDFDLVYYLHSDVVRKIELELSKLKNEKLKISQREFNGIQINEVHLSKRVFSWISVEKYWVGSFTPLLIEDVIRTYKSKNRNGFNVEIEGILTLPRIKNDAGNLYLNLKNINSLFSLFLEGNTRLPILGKAGLLDIKAGEGNVTMNGFSVLQNDDTELLSYFNSQDPVPFGLKNYISNRSISVVNYGISNGELLLRSLSSTDKNESIITREILSTEIIKKLFSSLGKEIAVCSFESRGSNLSRVLLIETSDIDFWKNTFDKLSNTIQQGDTVYYEKYSSYEIRQIEVNDFPELLFKPLVNGFAQTYYTMHDKILMISDRPEELRRVLDDIDRDEVWGKSIAVNQFLESTLLESNVSIYVNGPRGLSALASLLNPKWKSVHQSLDKTMHTALGFSAYQFSHLNESYYTNLVWSFNSGGVKESVQSTNKIVMNIDQPIVTKPFAVRNHTTKKDDIVVQDSLYTIHYFSADGKHQWRKNVSGAIIGDVHQLDYLNNNKLQLFFVTNGKLHVIDRLGNYVSPFPVSIAQQSIEYVSLLDYDNSKKYRYLLADKAGKLWLTDKEGKVLDGWRPLNLESSLVSPASHHRIRGKDFILCIRKDGRVYLLNRRGETIPGFPLNLDVWIDGSYFLETGNSLSNTYFTVVSKDGIKIKFTVDGKIISRETLVKTSMDDQFSLITDKNLKSYIIKQQNSRRLTLLDESGKTVLTNEYVGSSSVTVQFYDFGANRSFILISDQDQQLCYTYTAQGELIRTVPFEASGVSLILDGDRVIIATVEGSSLTLQPLVN
jgi:hypothetical protein